MKKDVSANTMASKAGNSGGGTTGRGVRTLPYQEYMKRREEGRCFHCGGPYSPGHRCAERSIRVMILAEEDEDEKAEASVKVEQKAMELSGLSASGLSQSNTMKLQGWVQGKRVLVLIDSGATHSFISTRLVKELGLKCTDTRCV